MVKNRMAKLVGTAMAAALMLSVMPAQTFANENEAAQEINFDHEQYEYARQELEIAIDLLDNADLTKVENYDRMMAFTTAAKSRLEGMDSNEHVDSLYTFVEEVFAQSNTLLRIMNDIQTLENVIDREDVSVEDKNAYIDALNEAIIYARQNTKVNYATINTATLKIHEFANKLENDTTEKADAEVESNFDHEQYEYARQEIEIAIDLLDNADLTKVENYDRMMAFTTAAKSRLEGMDSNEHVDSLYTFVEEVLEQSNVLLRIMNDMNSLEEAFSREGVSDEDKNAYIDALNEAIIYARQNTKVNHATINTATYALHHYANQM